MGGRVAEVRREQGWEVRLDWTVDRVHHADGRVTAVSGPRGVVRGDQFVSTLPIRDLVAGLEPPAPPPVRHAADSLGHRDFVTVALVIDRAEVFPDNWIYIHEPGVRVGRLQNCTNCSPDMVADPSRTCS